MGIAVLGPLQVDGQANGLSPRDRVVLSALVVRAGEPITTETLADALWGETLPASWAKVLQGCVVRLRKRLGGAAIQSAANGYRLVLTDDELDHKMFERLLEGAREALAAGDPARSSYLAREALQLWRGPVLPDLEEWQPGRVETSRLEGLRMDAEEVLVEAEIDAGRARDVLERGRALAAQAPFRERRWALLARALHQTGRQPEALGAIKRARAMLVEEFGLDPGRELIELEAMLLRQDPSLSPGTSPEVSATCPYRGLLPYDAADADTFFGREDDIAACLRRLRDTGVLVVIGPSGVGKSSLIRAGVVASLSRSGTPVLLTTPGEHPMDSLVELKPRGRQTLVVDQAEEAVTVCTDPEERARFFAALAVHVGAGGSLVLGLRADHLGDLAPHPEIARVLEEGMYLLGPMSEPGLRSAIEGPARRAGLRLEAGLVDLLVREVDGEPAALPLLSHVLRETWERREGPTLTVAGYRSTGGIRQAVSRSAESLYDTMDPAGRTQLRSLLLRLVMPTEDGDPVRARVPRAKVAVDAGHERLVERLVEARLVSIDGDTLQIAHEALVRVWPRLRGWLDDDVDGQRLFRHLAGAADAWVSMGRPDSELYRGTRLSRTLEWRERTTPDLNDSETAFLDVSVALSTAELRAAQTRAARERRATRRLRSALAGVGVLLVLALAAGILAVRSAERASQDRSQKEAAARLAEARRAGAQAAGQDNIATALLLAVEALRVDTSAQAWEDLATVLTRAGPLVGVRDAGGEAVSTSVSPDGRQAAISLPADADRPGVRLFDTASLEPVMEAVRFEHHTPSSIVRFSPDGGQLAVAVNQWVEDRQAAPRIDAQPLRLYDLPGGRLSDGQLGGFRNGDSIEYALDFSDDGRRLASVVQHYDRESGHFTRLGNAVVWDLARPAQPIFQVPVPEAGKVALSPDGRQLYAAAPGPRPLRAYDVDSGRLLRSVDNPLRAEIGDLDLSPDGATLAVTAGERIFRYAAGTLRPRGAVMRGHGDSVLDIDYSHDGRFLVTASTDRSTIVWDAATGALLHRFVLHGAKPVHSGQLWDAEWSPDDHTVYTTDWDELLFMTWRLDQVPGLLTLGEATPAVEKDGYDVSLPASDGHTLARIRAGRLWFLDTLTGRETPRSAPLPGLSTQWSSNSRRLLSTGPDERLRVWDPATGDQVAVRQFTRGGELRSAFSPDAERVYVVDRTGKLLTLDSATLRQVYGGVAVGSGVSALLPHPRDGSVFLLKIDGSFLRVEPETGKVVADAPAGTLTGIFDLAGALSPDGSVLATTDPTHSLRLLDVETLEWISPDPGVDSDANLTYAPDGSQFASVQSGRISLWDGRTGEYRASLPLPALATDVSIAYLPNSSGLLIAAKDGRTWTADTRTGTWIERACAIAGRNLTEDEWTQFFPSRPYHATCPQRPHIGRPLQRPGLTAAGAAAAGARRPRRRAAGSRRRPSPATARRTRRRRAARPGRSPSRPPGRRRGGHARTPPRRTS